MTLTTIIPATELQPGDTVVHFRGNGSFVVRSVSRAYNLQVPKVKIETDASPVYVSKYARLHVQRHTEK